VKRIEENLEERLVQWAVVGRLEPGNVLGEFACRKQDTRKYQSPFKMRNVMEDLGGMDG
jgi:hypothetical protein